MGFFRFRLFVFGIFSDVFLRWLSCDYLRRTGATLLEAEAAYDAKHCNLPFDVVAFRKAQASKPQAIVAAAAPAAPAAPAAVDSSNGENTFTTGTFSRDLVLKRKSNLISHGADPPPSHRRPFSSAAEQKPVAPKPEPLQQPVVLKPEPVQKLLAPEPKLALSQLFGTTTAYVDSWRPVVEMSTGDAGRVVTPPFEDDSPKREVHDNLPLGVEAGTVFRLCLEFSR